MTSEDISAGRQPSAPAVHESQWVGVLWRDSRWALPLAQVAAVFRAAAGGEAKVAESLLDLEVHAGEPVFVVPFENCFEVSLVPQALAGCSSPWVLVLAGATGLACRVDEIVGPFHAVAKQQELTYQGQVWVVSVRSEQVHA